MIAHLYGDAVDYSGHNSSPALGQAEGGRPRTQGRPEAPEDGFLAKRTRMIEPIIDKVLNGKDRTKRVKGSEIDSKGEISASNESQSLIDDPSEIVGAAPHRQTSKHSLLNPQPIGTALGAVPLDVSLEPASKEKVIDIKFDVYPGHDSDNKVQGQENDPFEDDDDFFVL
jgi:hypothetical protein